MQGSRSLPGGACAARVRLGARVRGPQSRWGGRPDCAFFCPCTSPETHREHWPGEVSAEMAKVSWSRAGRVSTCTAKFTHNVLKLTNRRNGSTSSGDCIVLLVHLIIHLCSFSCPCDTKTYTKKTKTANNLFPGTH